MVVALILAALDSTYLSWRYLALRPYTDQQFGRGGKPATASDPMTGILKWRTADRAGAFAAGASLFVLPRFGL